MAQCMVLRYCPDIYADTGKTIAVLIHEADQSGGSRLVLHTVQAWSSEVDEQDVEYISAIFQNCADVEGSDSAALFESLSQMSAGALRANAPQEYPIVSAASLEALLASA